MAKRIVSILGVLLLIAGEGKSSLTISGITLTSSSEGEQIFGGISATEITIDSATILADSKIAAFCAEGTPVYDGYIAITNSTVYAKSTTTYAPENIGFYNFALDGNLVLPEHGVVKGNDGNRNYTVELEVSKYYNDIYDYWMDGWEAD